MFHESYVDVFIEKSKCDHLREGHIVKISKTGSTACPIYWLRKYLDATNLNHHPDGYIFCRLHKTKKGHNVDHSHPITYETARKTFLDHLSQALPEDLKLYGLHSLRSGGASAAANNDVSDRLIGKHGRWSSNSSRDRYVKDSNVKRLRVSQSLGL